jgi:hypothetical protein
VALACPPACHLVDPLVDRRVALVHLLLDLRLPRALRPRRLLAHPLLLAHRLLAHRLPLLRLRRPSSNTWCRIALI